MASKTTNRKLVPFGVTYHDAYMAGYRLGEMLDKKGIVGLSSKTITGRDLQEIFQGTLPLSYMDCLRAGCTDAQVGRASNEDGYSDDEIYHPVYIPEPPPAKTPITGQMRLAGDDIVGLLREMSYDTWGTPVSSEPQELRVRLLDRTLWYWLDDDLIVKGGDNHWDNRLSISLHETIEGHAITIDKRELNRAMSNGLKVQSTPDLAPLRAGGRWLPVLEDESECYYEMPPRAPWDN